MKKIEKICSLVFIAFLLCATFPLRGEPKFTLGDGKGKVPFRVPRIEDKIRIDGVLDDESWQQALVMDLKYEIEPADNGPAPVKTQVLMAYNKSHLYVAFRSYDPDPSAIRSRFTDRDNFTGDDSVSILLNTFNDNRRTYVFSCNPLGVQEDYIYSMQGGGRHWDGIWDSHGRVTPEGYVVEMAIPFTTLIFQHSSEDQVWGVDAIRAYPRTVLHYVGLFPRDRNVICFMCLSEKLIGFSGVKPGKNLELDPTLTTQFTQEREGGFGGDFVEKEAQVDPGLTVKWNMTPNMMFNAAVNPDFSNVEADVAQLDVNLQFALYYPEKRPFFLEGLSIFNTRIPGLHTRSVADPTWGVKLAGKTGRNAIGFFSTRDSITNIIFPGSYSSRSTSLGLNNTSSVLRYRRDFGKSTNLGLLITDREGDDYFNRMAGVDGDIYLSGADCIKFQFLGSQTHYPGQVALDFGQPEGRFDGTMFDVAYYHIAKHLDYYIDYQQASPGFRADLGFIPQVGYRNINAGIHYTWLKGKGHWYNWLDLGTSYYYESDFDGNLIYKNLRSWVEYRGPLQSYFRVDNFIGKRYFQGLLFDYIISNFNFHFRPSEVFYVGLVGSVGDQLDFMNVQPGEIFRLNPIIEYSLGKRLTLELNHIYERLNVEAGRLYTANVSNLKLVYNFNRRTFLRAILQYVDYDYESKNFSFPIDPEFKHFFTQVLFSYKFNPRTVLFLGYSDDSYGYLQIPMTQLNRTVFLKLGYALRL